MSSGLSSLEWWEIFLGGISTLAIYTFLIRENQCYRVFEHFFIGIATAITIMKGFRDFLWPQFFRPLLGYDRIAYPDGTFAAPYDTRLLLYLIPMAFGMLYYFILTKRLSWLAQLPIGFSLGVGAGLFFKGFFNEFLPQFYDCFKPLYLTPAAASSDIVWQWDLFGLYTVSIAYRWYEIASNIVFSVTLICSLTYFFFTFKRKPGGLVERSASLGRFLMMGCFGAFFGSTIMARMALLVERLQFLIDKWFPNFMHL